MIQITTRGKTVDVPQWIDELTPRQYRYYCILASMLAASTISLEYFRIRWISFLAGLGRLDYTMLRPEHIAEIEGQTSGLMNGYATNTGQPAPHDVRIEFDTPRNLLPELAGYIGPGDWLNGMKFGEFVECATIIETLASANEAEAAESYEAIARILYHIPATDKVPALLAFHAPMLFGNVWKRIQGGPIEINGRKIDFTIIFKAAGPRRPDDKTGWTGITFEVATAGLFGNVSDVETADFWAVLMYLYKCKFEYINDLKQHKKNTANK
ncbi:MAG: hypothetical protein K2M06_04055 [Muribaculaceae bacterium]|nr:hypothetical protein [Muribaculaceae bacterium]